MCLLIVLVLFWWLSLSVKEVDFIFDLEYGMVFYKNFRGVVCVKCYGIKGEK